jgi:hypothetical protein
MTGMHHHAQLLVEMGGAGSLEIFNPADLGL